jgi:hypothetical protein
MEQTSSGSRIKCASLAYISFTNIDIAGLWQYRTDKLKDNQSGYREFALTGTEPQMAVWALVREFDAFPIFTNQTLRHL